MSFVDQIFGNLRGSGIVYLICIAAVVGAFKYLGDHPQAKRFTLIGAGLILAAGIGGGLLQAVLFQVIVGTTTVGTDYTNLKDMQKQLDAQQTAIQTWATISGILAFVLGLAHAAGIASLAYAVFVDKMELKAKKRPAPKRPTRPSRDEDEDEDEDDEDDRPRRRPRRD